MKNYMVGNWKMNNGLAEINTFFKSLDIPHGDTYEAWIAPQYIHIGSCLADAQIKNVQIGAQNCSEHDSGAYTGEVSAKFLKDIGANFVIIGHSERRSYQAESNQLLNNKVLNALENNLKVIYCVGETLSEREENKTLDTVSSQIKEGLTGINSAQELLIAYEPVWAIGTGKTATPEQAQEVHAHIRQLLIEQFGESAVEIPILYGGSVKPANIEALLKQRDINGGLVGGASLKAGDFSQLCLASSK